jgi:hypothetical protein
MNLHELQTLADRINRSLESVPDSDWNYSRIYVTTKQLSEIDGPYALWVEQLDVSTAAGRRELKAVSEEVTWGERHSNELGILELISLRLNKALLQTGPVAGSDQKRMVIRIVKKEELFSQAITAAFWYVVREVAGEDFQNR